VKGVSWGFGGWKNNFLDIIPHSVMIPSEFPSPIPLPGRKVWYGDFEPHFRMVKEWGFYFRARANLI